MGDELAIVDVQVTSPRTVSVLSVTQSGVAKDDQRWFDVVVTLRNGSRRITYQCISELRYLHYDSETATVYVGFFEAAPHPQVQVSHVRPPVTTAVLPGGSAVISARVPEIIHRISVESGTRGHDALDTSKARRLTCRVAYSLAPFRVRPRELVADALHRLGSWDVTKEFTVAMNR